MWDKEELNFGWVSHHWGVTQSGQYHGLDLGWQLKSKSRITYIS